MLTEEQKREYCRASRRYYYRKKKGERINHNVYDLWYPAKIRNACPHNCDCFNCPEKDCVVIY